MSKKKDAWRLISKKKDATRLIKISNSNKKMDKTENNNLDKMEAVKKKASAVMYVTFYNNPDSPRTFYSRDIQKNPDNLNYWFNHLRNLAEIKWKGKVQEFVIYRMASGTRTGDPIIKRKYDIFGEEVHT